MYATGAAALPRHRTEHLGLRGENRLYRAGKPTRSRPDLRVVPHGGSQVAVALPVSYPPVSYPAVSSAPGSLRLTRRGRIVVAVMVALLVAGLSLAAASAAQATGRSASQRGTGSGLLQVVVRPGQSLWSVAQNADPNSDPRLVIQQIAQLNALTGDVLIPGQRLWVPRN
jgi:LysM domain